MSRHGDWLLPRYQPRTRSSRSNSISLATELVTRTSSGLQRTLSLEPQTVAEFYQRIQTMLRGLGIAVDINEMPNELPDPIPFSKDYDHHAYDAAAAHAFWRVLIQMDRILKRFRSAFIGKASPVHFFWEASILPSRAFLGVPRRLIPAVSRDFPTPSCAKRIHMK